MSVIEQLLRIGVLAGMAGTAAAFAQPTILGVNHYGFADSGEQMQT